MGNSLIVLGWSLILTIATTGMLFAQQDNNNQGRGRGGFGRGNFDPAQMQERMLERTTTDLKMTNQEAKIIVPKIRAILIYRFSSGQDLQPLYQDLADLVNAEKPNEKAILQQLNKIKAKESEIKKKSEAMEEELKKILSVEQEAQLTLRRVVNSSTGFFGGGFGGGRGGFGGRGGGRGGNNGGNNN